ncbi:MAG: prepilin-type N-terminal cleavage/methylation domain-containing protein [bacterium]
MRRLRRIRGQGGMTLIEFSMAIALSGVVFMALYTILDATLDSYAIGQLRSAAAQGARVTMTRMVNEVRFADRVYAGSDGQRILFRRPLEDDSGGTTVIDLRYDPSTGDITREQDFGGPMLIAEDVSGLTLTYWDRSFAPVGATGEVRFIHVDLRLTREDYTIPLRNLITLANPVTLP